MLDLLNVTLAGNSNITNEMLGEIKKSYFNARLQKQQADDGLASGVENNKTAFAKLKAIQNKK